MTTLEIILSVGLLLQLASHVSTFRAAAKVSDRVLVIEQALWPSKFQGQTYEHLTEQQRARAAEIVRMVASPPAELRAVLARNGWERGT